MKLIKVGILFGGKSGEHEVSIQSASNILREIDRSKYYPIPIGIKKNGKIASDSEIKSMLPPDLLYILDNKSIQTEKTSIDKQNSNKIINNETNFGLSNDVITNIENKYDVIFPVLHGPNGEDGTIQGLLELMDIPYVGSGVLGSSTGMDKEIMKRIFMSHDLPILPFYSFKKFQWDKDKSDVIKNIEYSLTYPAFVKPANMGSSVGITKAHNRNELIQGVDEALQYDIKIVVEQGINAREIEISILGNDNPITSVLGEIIPCKEFYDYEAKYLSEGSKLIIPAQIDSSIEQNIKECAIKAFLALDCSGLARIDFFIDKLDNKVYINEINTLPGFTKISMYPKLWEVSGIPYPKLIDQLITLAIEKHKTKPS
ncbi:MAG: D-alanine--D-alanine ligase [Spirochaetota bacterium]|nr:D-alanine--D-alanine ligase [Spirochaetota bacterium]